MKAPRISLIELLVKMLLYKYKLNDQVNKSGTTDAYLSLLAHLMHYYNSNLNTGYKL